MTHAHAFAPATRARPATATRLLVVRVASRRFYEAPRDELPRLLEPGDVVVVNDAATLPASLVGETSRGEAVELRLLAPPDAAGECDAAVLGEGDYRTPTERRAAPPRLSPGDRLRLGALSVTVVGARGRSARVRIEAGRDEALAAIYGAGRPVQYAHVPAPLPLWDVQNVYAAEPWAVEMPSAGRVLDFAALDALRRRGVEIARVTHGAGLSSIDGAALDASLPWPERYRIPQETAEAVARARARSGPARPRVIAVGTSVVRALESSAAAHGEVRAEVATTDLRIDAGHRVRAVDGLLTGMHEPPTSHADLVAAFVPRDLLSEASAFAVARGFLGHELGDACLILPD
jgi:S-adenosylmethionine:tRNA ribosyltransferase-isomerase